jgi:hypothetical protein
MSIGPEEAAIGAMGMDGWSAGVTNVLKGDGADAPGIGPSMRFAMGDAPGRDVGLGGVASEVEPTED